MVGRGPSAALVTLLALPALPALPALAALAALAALPTLLAPTSAHAAPIEGTVWMGLGKPDGSDAEFDQGFELSPGGGLSVGTLVSGPVSVHAQLALYRLEPNQFDDAEIDLDAAQGLLTGALLFHTDRRGPVDLVFGPSLGRFWWDIEIKEAGGDGKLTQSVSGNALGWYAALMLRLSEHSRVGPVLQFHKIWATEVCIELSEGGESFDDCDDSPSNRGEPTLFSINLGMSLTL